MTQITQRKIALSQYHDGQMVRPFVRVYEGRQNPHGNCFVELEWTGSDSIATFRGSRRSCEDWLKRQGVHLDAQGIY